MKLDEVVIYVKDFKAALGYYGDVLGLPVKFVFEEDGVARLDAGGVTLLLHSLHGEEAREEPLVCFQAENIAATVELLNTRGAGIGPVVDEGWGQIVRFTDPEGNKLAVYRMHAAHE